MFYFVTSGPWTIVNARLFFGHGYVFYAYTMILFGAYGIYLVRRYGYRGLFLSIILGLTCDIGMSFLNVLPSPVIYEVFTWNYGLEPVFWFTVILLCWLASRPLKVNLISWWTTGMLLFWLFEVQLAGWFGAPILKFLEPATIASWILASYHSVRPA